jgi:prepilin peptidase CpaA
METNLLKFCGLGLLAGLLALAVRRDLASYRIPNLLVFGGIAAALVLHALPGEGHGLLATPAGPGGILFALGGLAVGLGMLLPLYMIGASGAGDVKLMAMVGAFLGPLDATAATLASYLAGMALAVLAMARPAVFAAAGRNLRLIFWGFSARLAGLDGPRFEARNTAVKVPYSLAIAGGTIGWSGWKLWL